MISLEQIRLLEAKITKTVELIKTLKAENSSLRGTLDSAQARMQDLEKLVGDLKTDQKEIEASIVRAIRNLDELEDEVSRPGGGPGPGAGDATEAGESDEEGTPHDPTPAPPRAKARAATGEPEAPTEADEDSERELDIF